MSRLLHLPFALLSFFLLHQCPKYQLRAVAQGTPRGDYKWRLDKQTHDLTEKLDVSFRTCDLGGRRRRVVARKGQHKF